MNTTRSCSRVTTPDLSRCGSSFGVRATSPPHRLEPRWRITEKREPMRGQQTQHGVKTPNARPMPGKRPYGKLNRVLVRDSRPSVPLVHSTTDYCPNHIGPLHPLLDSCRFRLVVLCSCWPRIVSWWCVLLCIFFPLPFAALPEMATFHMPLAPPFPLVNTCHHPRASLYHCLDSTLFFLVQPLANADHSRRPSCRPPPLRTLLTCGHHLPLPHPSWHHLITDTPGPSHPQLPLH
jgi:hypothetical protein